MYGRTYDLRTQQLWNALVQQGMPVKHSTGDLSDGSRYFFIDLHDYKAPDGESRYELPPKVKELLDASHTTLHYHGAGLWSVYPQIPEIPVPEPGVKPLEVRHLFPLPYGARDVEDYRRLLIDCLYDDRRATEESPHFLGAECIVLANDWCLEIRCRVERSDPQALGRLVAKLSLDVALETLHNRLMEEEHSFDVDDRKLLAVVMQQVRVLNDQRFPELRVPTQEAE